jgi:hypothetical protein
MTIIDTIWIGSIAVAFMGSLIAALSFYRQEGRTRVYLAQMMFSWALLAAVSLVTAFRLEEADGTPAIAFKLPRAMAWALVAITCTRYLMFQLGILNSEKRPPK